jgi:hypothetical protein
VAHATPQRSCEGKRYSPVVALVFAVTVVWPLFGGSADLLFASFQNLAADRVLLFEDGRKRFLQIEDVAHGLGPAYNGTSCAGCHNQPIIGGVGNAAVIHAGVVRDGRYEVPPGGDLIHLFSIGDHSCQPRIPADANNLARRILVPLFGAGLIEAIPDSVIRVWEDPDDRNNDGIRRRAALVMDPATRTMRVGRFGWKAHQAMLLFSATS